MVYTPIQPSHIWRSILHEMGTQLLSSRFISSIQRSALLSSLRAAHYRYGSLYNHRMPCSVCESGKRVSQLMIPAKTRCPSNEWTLEYKGYLGSSAEYKSNSGELLKNHYFRGSYICVDENPESLTGKSHPREGPQIYQVNAACGNVTGALTNCPPYQANKALSCVVCSK